MKFDIPSSDEEMLVRARKTAVEFAQQRIGPNTAGVVFLGAVARGYYDPDADVDIALFERDFAAKYEVSYAKVEGLEVQCFRLDLEAERQSVWSTGKRWAYSDVQLFYDPEGEVSQLLAEKVPLTKDERFWSLISGMALSEWYANRLPDLWLRRGSALSAHYVIGEGVNQFLGALFALNNELLPDFKWRVYCAARLERVPAGLERRLGEVLAAKEVTAEEIQRQRTAFMSLWHEFLPAVEADVGMTFEQFNALV